MPAPLCSHRGGATVTMARHNPPIKASQIFRPRWLRASIAETAGNARKFVSQWRKVFLCDVRFGCRAPLQGFENVFGAVMGPGAALRSTPGCSRLGRWPTQERAFRALYSPAGSEAPGKGWKHCTTGRGPVGVRDCAAFRRGLVFRAKPGASLPASEDRNSCNPRAQSKSGGLSSF
jgi:hypothetical protein